MNPKKPTSYSDQIKVLTEANYKKVKSKLIFKKPKEEDYKESLEAFNILKKNLTAQFKGSDLPRQFTSKLKDIHEKELKKLNETNPGVDHYKQNLVEESLNSLGGNLGLRLFDIIEDKIDKLSQEISCGILTM